MSMIKTLAKVAVGVAVAKGVAELAKGRTASGHNFLQHKNDDTILAKIKELAKHKKKQSELEALVGGLLGGGKGAKHKKGLGDVLDKAGSLRKKKKDKAKKKKKEEKKKKKHGLGHTLVGLAEIVAVAGAADKIRKASAERLANTDIATGEVSGTKASAERLANTEIATGEVSGTFGDLLNELLVAGGAEPSTAPSEDMEAGAEILLRSMIQAAKADGIIDDKEAKQILEIAQSATPEEQKVIEDALNAPVNVKTLVASVPHGLEPQVYVVSVLSIDVDDQQGAQYLADLSSALGLSPEVVDAIHDEIGAPLVNA